MKQSFKILLLLLLTTGCGVKNGKEEIEKKIQAKADDCKGAANCIVKIADLTSFKWDGLCVFNTPLPKQDVETALGVPYPDYEEGTRPLIFFYQGKIVYSENNPNGLIKGTPGQVIYDYAVGLHYGVYNPQNAVFNVKVEKGGPKTFYSMHLVRAVK
ncbi:hypothetical protein BDD43_5146 [Mucilaginibacter gracilis]|uniref:Lipoprotein n=1 Tax=Mucilaginibacter gracilis TaxID=423350 RepID=A0A495J811_9SPHI|nr:hypothetical protein [Mucilaginibacter gracilis]RKR84893.1 hypothetical protein BDD43_5146 [Mucilaginibacter gracilis]